MKSVTVTTHRSYNYGGVLQAYALHKIQKDLGIENSLLETSYGKAENKKNNKFPSRAFFNLIIIDIIKFLYQNRTKKRIKRFDDFVRENIDTTHNYSSMEELRNHPPKADFYITGSDQVFTVRGPFSYHRMLQFGQNIRKYSYAASIADVNWTEKEAQEFCNILKSYSMVSVREKSAKDIIELITGIKPYVHLDPVFLLDAEEWKKSAGRNIINGKYILCYPLLGNKNMQKILDELKEKTGYKTVCIQPFPIKRVKADQYIFDAGPSEFLSLISNASYVVTTSFHGTAFSLIFHKPFYTLIKNTKSERMTDLLEMMNLSDRIYSEKTDINAENIDFSFADKVIKSEKEKSIEYLNKIRNEVMDNG